MVGNKGDDSVAKKAAINIMSNCQLDSRSNYPHWRFVPLKDYNQSKAKGSRAMEGSFLLYFLYLSLGRIHTTKDSMNRNPWLTLTNLILLTIYSSDRWTEKCSCSLERGNEMESSHNRTMADLNPLDFTSSKKPTQRKLKELQSNNHYHRTSYRVTINPKEIGRNNRGGEA